MEPEREGRNLVLFFDGTGDWAGDDTTNVMKIYERLQSHSDQVAFYTGGVGTLGSQLALTPTHRMFLKLLDLASATSLRDKVLEGYEFLVKNYRPADENRKADNIYMFGFSRGAFTARLLAAVLHNFGLLDPSRINLMPYLWQTISEFRTYPDFVKDAAMIKRQFSRPIPLKIHFLGLFDTVSSVGIFERFKVYPYTDRNPSVEHVRHAVSIDEQRNAFPELLAIPDGNDVVEIWFPGVHRDVGGGAEDHSGLSNQTLNWMLGEASKLGLAVDTTPAPTTDKTRHIAWNPYAFVGLYPMKMFDHTLKQLPKGDPGFRWFWPNFRHPRSIPKNAIVYKDSKTVIKDGQEMPLEGACCTDPPTSEPTRPNLFDAVGTLLGVALAFLVLWRGLAEPIINLISGPAAAKSPWLAWPVYAHSLLQLSSTCVFYIFLLFVIHQSVWQKIETSKSGTTVNVGIQALLVLAAVAVVIGFWPWYVFGVALAIGLVVTLVSEFPPLPILRADRAVGYFMVPWFLIVVTYWLAGWILNLIGPATIEVGGFLAFGHPFAIQYKPALAVLAVAAAVITTVSGIGRILRDRRLMSTNPADALHNRSSHGAPGPLLPPSKPSQEPGG